MNRPFRLYGKKRGNRRSGSSLGKAWLATFFAVFLLGGCGFLGLLIYLLVLPEWRVNHRFVEGRCEVLQKRIGESRAQGSATYRPEFLLRYEVDGETYETWSYDATKAYSSGLPAKQSILQRYEVGKQYACWYDPRDPETVVLVRGYTWVAWMMLLLPLTFIAVGGSGVIYHLLSWSTSAERRLALARKVTQLELFEGSPGGRELPGVPSEVDLTNSPGTRLAYRLPMAVSPGWALVAMVAACLFWNGMVTLFLVIAIDSHLRAEPEWFLTLFILPFVLIGCGLIYFTIQQLLLTTGVGPTLVEISDHPLYPAREYEVFVSQSGRLTMHGLKVLLVCQERATYQQGTNSRTETSPVFEQEVYSHEHFEIQQDEPLEATARLRVPADAMHSFRSAHNEVQWKLIVKGHVAGWPGYEREFPLLVYPAGDGGSPA